MSFCDFLSSFCDFLSSFCEFLSSCRVCIEFLLSSSSYQVLSSSSYQVDSENTCFPMSVIADMGRGVGDKEIRLSILKSADVFLCFSSNFMI